jgi:hypothetical protein
MISAKQRVAIHMAAALPLDLPPRRTAFHVWKWWMHLALMAFASTWVAVGVVYILRKGM